MADELKYHEQQEGWSHEWLTDKHCVCLKRPTELGGGFVTVDFERRVFGCGYGRPRTNAGAAEYTGRGWKDRIVRDAIEHLEHIMADNSLATQQLVDKLKAGHELYNRGTGWWLSAPKRAGRAADAAKVDDKLIADLEAAGTLQVVMLTRSMRAQLAP